MNADHSADYVAQPRLTIVPLSLRAANDFVALHHRHHKPARGHKFSVGVEADGVLVGVAIAGRPVSRHYDDGLTLEVNRTCTDGTDNANSCLYGAAWRTAKGMGYRCAITYTQEGESGASLRAAGWRVLRYLPARGSWAESSIKLKGLRDPVGNGGVARALWGIGDCSHIVSDPELIDGQSGWIAERTTCGNGGGTTPGLGSGRGPSTEPATERRQTLASLHPEEFERLLDAERALEGLPPVHTVKRGRPAQEVSDAD